MKKKLFILFVSLLCAILFLSACGKDEKVTKEEKPKSAAKKDKDEDKDKEDEKDKEEKDDEEAFKEEEDDKDDKKENDKSKDSGDYSKESKELIKYIEDETEGKTNVLFENTEPQTVKLKAVTAELEGYTVMEFKDFHRNFDIPFDRKDKGAIILAKYSVENTTDEDMQYMPDFSVFYPGYTKATNTYRDLLPREEDVQLNEILSPKTDYLLKAGEKVEGYYAYPFSEENFKEIQDKKTINTKVSPGFADIDDFSSRHGDDGQFTISLNEEGAKKKESNAKFYEDRITKDDMGDKKMLKEKEDIDKSEKLGKSKVTLKGYQFTEFTPNDVEAPRFEQNKNGMVLLTVKFNMDNKEDKTVDTSSISSKLTMNNGSQRTLNDGMLLPLGRDGKVEKGEEDDFLQVYFLDGEQYEKILKDKDFEIEIGPLRDDQGKDISKGNVANFNLPK